MEYEHRKRETKEAKSHEVSCKEIGDERVTGI